MDSELYNKVSVWFEEHREQMKEDIMRLVRIPSISAPCEESGLSEAFPHQEAPFGHACRACLEEMLAIGREHGFHTENYGNRVGSIGEEKKDWENMIGFWNHMDVVPVGNQWVYEPFEPMVEEPFLIGRGAQDNKGPAVGILYMMECLRELEVPIKHQLCLFVGTDEERGMEDLEYYTRYYPTPLLSMVADSGFPVCYGEKGIVEGRMYSREPVSGMILELVGGSASNMIPDEAYAVLVRTQRMERAVEATLHKMAKGLKSRKRGPDKQEKPECLIYPEITMKMSETEIRVIAKGKSGHSAFPEGSMNAIHSLLCFLAELDTLSYEDRVLFDRLAFLSEEYYGEHLEIACGDEVSGRTTCAATVLGMENGRIFLHFNIRYAITINQEELLKGLKRAGEKNELIWMLERNSKPNYFPKEHMAVSRLTALYNEITGSRKESFVMGGGTYARKLPRAFAYGVGGMEESEEDKKVRKKLFLPGHGGAHEPDEGLNLRLLADAMKIYAMAMVELNHCEL